MTKSADNLRFFGDLDSAVYRAPSGTTMPTTPTGALDAGFEEVGWLADDGIDFDRDTDTTEVNAYQASRLLRRKTNLKGETLKFQALENNAVVLAILYPDADIAHTGSAPNVLTTITPSGKATDNAAWVVDLIDDDVIERYAITDGDAAVVGTIPHKATDPTVYEIELTINDYVKITNNQAVATA